MGLGDIVDSEDTESSDDGNKGEFNHITVEEFEEFLDQFDFDWNRTTTSEYTPYGEYVYGTKDPINEEHNTLYLTVFSTIEEASGKTREKGTDAIRTVIWDNHINKPVGGKKKTLRIKTWRKNLKRKIDELADSWKEHVTICDECGSYMKKREGQYGEFYGCTSYPKCENTKQVD